MGFLTPWFLAGAVAVGLPVWLHLLRKHKTTPLPFSSLMFFEKRTQSSIKHRRLRYLLLFALRALLVLLLVLAFAHPYVRQTVLASKRSGEVTVLAIDNSLSMRAGTRLVAGQDGGQIGGRRTARRTARPGAGLRFARAGDERSHRRPQLPERRHRFHRAGRHAHLLRANFRARCAPSRNRSSCRWPCNSTRTCSRPAGRRTSTTCA